MVRQKNTLQQECGFKEMSNVYFVVFVQAGPLCCSLKNHLSVACPPPIHQRAKNEVRCFYKQHFIWTYYRDIMDNNYSLSAGLV